MSGTCFSFEVTPEIPRRIARLQELADDLYYSWSSQTRYLFIYLDADLWQDCGHNPKLFLRRVSHERLQSAVRDQTFMESYHRVLSAYDTYLQTGAESCGTRPAPLRDDDLIAYFCLEFGFHESFPIYSGGLGILAGDHCKAASDLNVPLVAVGLLYRCGYFDQKIGRNGEQIAEYPAGDFAHMPIAPVRDGEGRERRIRVEIGERDIGLKLWRARAGKIALYLLDSDISENTAEDRLITHQLYGGDSHLRIRQEIVLGIGGVRALRALGLKPTVWHVNEGHGAFQIIERCREKVAAGCDFDAALEWTAAGTVFTTHTPVPAGHDIFSLDLAGQTLERVIRQLEIPAERFFALGRSPSSQSGFNMTALALRGSRFHNGVSRIHGGVAAAMESHVWPQIAPEENPIGYVTNGVHVPTFLAYPWQLLFDLQFGRDWRNRLLDPAYWERIDGIPDYTYWSTRQLLKAELLKYVRQQVVAQYERNDFGTVEIDRLTRLLDPNDTDLLILGFARRFATYKRATLLFTDLERLRRLLDHPERPVLLLFSGKAHPSDLPGQQLLRRIHEIAMLREFQGKVILVENYNLALARRLVTGVDVWLNTPEYPLEASGTSGQKAGINGVVNLSVLDGWWGEGYDGGNGWGLKPHPHYRDPAERAAAKAQLLLDILEEQVIPLYYDRNGHGYSAGWVRKSKASMKTIIPRFNAGRMLSDYVRDYYTPASRHRRVLGADHGAGARRLAAWKRKVASEWPRVSIRRLDEPAAEIRAGTPLTAQVAVFLAGLSPEDVVVECRVGRRSATGEFDPRETARFEPAGNLPGGETVYELRFEHSLAGLQFYQIRAYPFNPLLGHPFEAGRMIWL
jgi:starch phosphorylase